MIRSCVLETTQIEDTDRHKQLQVGLNQVLLRSCSGLAYILRTVHTNCLAYLYTPSYAQPTNANTIPWRCEESRTSCGRSEVARNQRDVIILSRSYTTVEIYFLQYLQYLQFLGDTGCCFFQVPSGGRLLKFSYMHVDGMCTVEMKSRDGAQAPMGWSD